MKVLNALFTSTFILTVSARSWKEIESVHATNTNDFSGTEHFNRTKAKLLNANFNSPRAIFNISEQLPSTNAPSPFPSVIPSDSPSFTPSSSPSTTPSMSPTVDPFPPGQIPRNPKQGYFNYDTSSEFGPEKWGNIIIPSKIYWSEFDGGHGPWKNVLKTENMRDNVCGDGKNQSPIDVRDTGKTCHEFHEIRDNPGDYGLVEPDEVQKIIDGNKLRLLYPRRPCRNRDSARCSEPDPPNADFPSGWPDLADVIHIDFKVKSEHLIEGERYDAEMQIFHIHEGRKRVGALATVIKAKVGGYNFYFQEALNAFQRQYNRNRSKCRRRLQGISSSTQNVTHPVIEPLGDQDSHKNKNNTKLRRTLAFKGGPWNPYHRMLIPTIHFYRYEGSLTEPPCGEFVTWWISDKAMTISPEQLYQMKTLLFTNLDTSCQLTGTHAGRTNARPVQNVNRRRVHKCDSSDFGPD